MPAGLKNDILFLTDVFSSGSALSLALNLEFESDSEYLDFDKSNMLYLYFLP